MNILSLLKILGDFFSCLHKDTTVTAISLRLKIIRVKHKNSLGIHYPLRRAVINPIYII